MCVSKAESNAIRSSGPFKRLNEKRHPAISGINSPISRREWTEEPLNGSYWAAAAAAAAEDDTGGKATTDIGRDTSANPS